MQGSTRANEVKKRIALSSVVKQAVQLKGNGPKYLGLCPFHQEKTPSFHVHDNAGRFKCFGCGASGDVIEFIMRLRGLGFKEAVAELADRCGLTQAVKSKISQKPLDPARDLLLAQKIAHEFFIAQLKTEAGGAARQYLQSKRHLSSAMIDQAALGFGGLSSKEFFSYLKAKGISQKNALELGLIKTQGSLLVPVFLGRIIFPIRRFDGKVVAFGGRSFLDSDRDAPKYVNTRAYSLFEKRKNFYGLFESKAAILKGKSPVLVEGYFDAMAIWAAGEPALALCGTALSQDHVLLIKRLCTRIIICFDSDEAGYKATRNALVLLAPKNINSSVVSLDKKDPGEYLGDINSLRMRLSNSEDALCFVIDRVALGAESDISRRILEIDQLMPIFTALSRPLIRRQYVVYLAKKLHEDPSLLWAEVCKNLRRKQGAVPEIAKPSAQAQVLTLTLNPTEKLVAQILSLYPELALKISPALNAFLPEGFSDHVLGQSHANTTLVQALKAEHSQKLDISLVEAEAFLVGLDKRVARLKARAQIKEKRQELQQAVKAKDFNIILKNLKEQSQILARAKPAKLNELKKPELSVSVPVIKPALQAADYLEDEDWF